MAQRVGWSSGIGHGGVRLPIGLPPGRGLVKDALDDVWGSTLHLVVNVSEVSTDNAQTQQLDAAKKKDEAKHHRKTARSRFGKDKLRQDLEYNRQEGKPYRGKRQPCDQVQRCV